MHTVHYLPTAELFSTSTLTEIVQHSNGLESSSTGLDGPFPSEILNDDLVKFNTIESTNQITHIYNVSKTCTIHNNKRKLLTLFV